MPLNMTGVVAALAAARQNAAVPREERTRALIFGGYGGPIAGVVAGENAVSRAELQEARQQVFALQEEIRKLREEEEKETEEEQLRSTIQRILREEMGASSGDGRAEGVHHQSVVSAPSLSEEGLRQLERVIDAFDGVMQAYAGMTGLKKGHLSKAHSELYDALKKAEEVVAPNSDDDPNASKAESENTEQKVAQEDGG